MNQNSGVTVLFVNVGHYYVQQIGHRPCKITSPACGQLNMKIRFSLPSTLVFNFARYVRLSHPASAVHSLHPG